MSGNGCLMENQKVELSQCHAEEKQLLSSIALRCLTHYYFFQFHCVLLGFVVFAHFIYSSVFLCMSTVFCLGYQGVCFVTKRGRVFFFFSFFILKLLISANKRMAVQMNSLSFMPNRRHSYCHSPLSLSAGGTKQPNAII